MILKNNFSIIFFIGLLVGITSCRQLVEDEFPDYDGEPAVNSVLIQGKPLTVYLSMTGKLDSASLPAIDNAKIELWVDGVFFEAMQNTGDGLYTSETLVEPLKSYTCKVVIPGYDTIVCSQTLPEATPIRKVEHVNIAGRDEEGTTYPAIKLTFPNNPSVRKYYEVEIRLFEYEETQSAEILNITDPVLLNEGLPIALFSNEVIEDTVYTLTLNYTTGNSSSTNGGGYRTTLFPFIIFLRLVSYDYYRYKKQYYLYETGSSADGLLTPVTASPIYSNIENASGIFAGYSVFATDTITPERYEN